MFRGKGAKEKAILTLRACKYKPLEQDLSMSVGTVASSRVASLVLAATVYITAILAATRPCTPL